ncbi:type II secretion system F family protein [Streptomyces sp. V4-01]|uniref:Type II secretion system F family protein n=1 Tax=Actinacidiphila polyblastidii TaxID=3110430 RepID=A0ABU7PLJ6_9ACTN|nr:type II secretion system F family protein [Streptomyces sp. V4-01]
MTAAAGVVHSLGTALAAALASLVAAVPAAADAARRRHALRRLRRALHAGPVRREPGRSPDGARRLLGRWAPVIGAALAPVVLLGGVLGVLAGAGAGIGLRRWLAAREAATGGSEAGEATAPPDPAQLPLCADLLAACLAAGAAPGEAAEAVGRCLDGPLGRALTGVAAELRLGADPAECWDRFGRRPGAQPMGRCLSRASSTGSAPVAEMSRLAADYRAGYGRSAVARARRAAVLATAPLGVCFLPAFLLLGVAPVVMGLAGTVLGTGAR